LVVGGFGVAKNFSDLAFKGQELSVAPDFMSVCSDFKEENRVCGYMCIAPALLPLIYNDVETTIGNDKDTVSCIESLGGKHICAKVDEVVIDVKNKVVTTPAYM
ncbi:isoprenoid biosynthesis protein ElbB, partial [Vibrio lentus]|nr:isoprenoid biosynthesis protein ElbB [Vibrio lentus]